MKTILLTAVIVALSGCASSGTQIDAGQLNEVRKGQTTVTDILKRFGRPDFLSKNWDGTQTAAYANTEGRPDGPTLLPLIGAVVTGGGSRVDSVVFYFDTNGVLTDYKSTQSATSRPAQAGVAVPVQMVSDAPAQNRIDNPAAKRPDTVLKNNGPSKLPWWLPSEIRDTRQ